MWARCLRAAAWLFAALSIAQGSARAAAWTANADDAILLEVRAGQYKLGDGVRGYLTPQGACLDLADTLLALDVQVRLDKQSRRATGWAFDERHGVAIDREAGIEQIKNVKRAIGPGDIRDTPEGWCVAPSVLSRWFGIALTADTGNALLVVKSDRALPAVAAAERRARAANARPAAAFDLASLPRARVVSRGFTMPAVDIVASVGGLRDRQVGSRGDVEYEAFVAGEIGPVAYNARLASDRSGRPASLRVQAYRTDPDARLLGPLRATTVAAGDVQGLSTPLVARSAAGRGAFVTNRPVERRDRFDRIDLRGDLPRGWDAELYRDGQLLGFAQDRPDGRYEFLDVALRYGANRLEVVLYGPQGQIRREARSVPVGLDSIPVGRTYYWAGVNDDGRDLIDLAARAPPSGGGWRGSLGIERGIDVRTSASVVFHSLVLDRVGRRNFAEASIRRAFADALVEISGAADTTGGTAVRLSAVGDVLKTRYAVETIWAHAYRSDRVDASITGLHTVSLDRVFGSGRTAIPVGIQARLTSRSGGDDTLDIAARISASIGSISATGELVLRQETRGAAASTRTIDAGMLVNTRVGRVRLRGEAHVDLAPARVRSLAVIGEWAAGAEIDGAAGWRAELGYERVLGRARAAIGYVRRFDRLALSASLEAASDGSVGAGVSIAFSLGRERRGGVRMTADKLAAQGSADVFVYRDTNGNGRRDDGEQGEGAVGLTRGLVAIDRLTDVDGRRTIDGLEPFQPVVIGVDAASLPDPMLQPAGIGVVVVPRPGIVAQVEIGLVPTGDVDGTLMAPGGGALEGVDLELHDAGGRRVATTRCEFDGFFLFERVPHGRYTVHVAALVAAALRLDPALGAHAVVGAATPSVHLGAVAARALVAAK